MPKQRLMCVKCELVDPDLVSQIRRLSRSLQTSGGVRRYGEAMIVLRRPIPRDHWDASFYIVARGVAGVLKPAKAKEVGALTVHSLPCHLHQSKTRDWQRIVAKTSVSVRLSVELPAFRSIAQMNPDRKSVV